MSEADTGSIGESVLLHSTTSLGVSFTKSRGMLHGGVAPSTCRIGDASGAGVDFNPCLVDFGVLKWH